MRQGACEGEDIPEDELKYACALAMGREEFDEAEFRERVSGISVTRGSVLEFTLADSRRLIINWRCL